MSEDPAPYWISRPEPMPSLDGRGWRATVAWVDVGGDLRWTSEALYDTYAEALVAAQDAEADEARFARLLTEHPIASSGSSAWRVEGRESRPALGE